MNNVSGLKKILSKTFKINKARLDCLSRLLLSLIAVRTVNLAEIALGLGRQSEIHSRYRRLQRFFSQFRWDSSQLARWIFYWFFLKGQKVYLILDRTNWYWGKKKINILLLSVAYEGLAIPLLWEMLPKAGNASSEEHQSIVKRYIDIFGKENIAGVLADREFPSGQFFKFLAENTIAFYFRIKDNARIGVGKEKFFTVKKIFCELRPKEKMQFGMAVSIYGQKVYLSGSRSERGQLMVVATLSPFKNGVETYIRRWEIENLFQGLKGRGFRFEETHLTAEEKLSTLIGVLAIAFSWAHKIGEWKALKKPIIFKHFRDQQRPQWTFFHYGLDCLRDILLNSECFLKEIFRDLLRLFPISYAEFLS